MLQWWTPVTCLPTTQTRTTWMSRFNRTDYYCLPQQFSHMQRMRREWETTGSTWHTLVYTRICREINKQMFLMKQEALSTQERIWVIRSAGRLSSSITDTDEGDEWNKRWVAYLYAFTIEVLSVKAGLSCYAIDTKIILHPLIPEISLGNLNRWRGLLTIRQCSQSGPKTIRPDCLNDFWSKKEILAYAKQPTPWGKIVPIN